VIVEDVPLHGFSQSTPLYGDATSTSALLFADPISDTGIPFQEPSFPRYDLPPPIPSSPTVPDSARSANSTLILVPTSSLVAVNGQPTSGLLKSGCFLQALSSSQLAGVTITPSLVLRNQTEGWRTQFLVEGLQPSTNYTSYTITTTQGGGLVLSQPASFKTKSAAFPCTLVHSLPFCPGVAWAAPFPPLAGNPTTYDSTNFPPVIQETLNQSLGNFTTSLKTFPCGREIYSIIQSCASCERAYRNWLCSVLIPRCGEIDTALVPPAALVPRSIAAPNTTSTSARLGQTVFSNGATPVTDYVELLPCLETCHAVDRACPPNIQWTCPREGLGAERSYGVGFVDREGDDVSGGGVQGGGRTGTSQDGNGNVWCNGVV
jgi:calcium channel MID1